MVSLTFEIIKYGDCSESLGKKKNILLFLVKGINIQKVKLLSCA